MSRPQHEAAIAGRRHALYRFFDDQDVLLYVGITHNLPTRMRNHKTKKPWWYDMADMRVEWFPDRKSVLAAEKAAIKNEKPLYNIEHNDEPYSDPFARLTTEEKLAYLSPTERDHLEVPAWQQGRQELAATLLGWFTNDEAVAALKRARSDTPSDELSGDGRVDALDRLMSERWTQNQGRGQAIEAVLRFIPPDILAACRRDAEEENQVYANDLGDSWDENLDLSDRVLLFYADRLAAQYLAALPVEAREEWERCGNKRWCRRDGRLVALNVAEMVQDFKQDGTVPSGFCHIPTPHGALCPEPVKWNAGVRQEAPSLARIQLCDRHLNEADAGTLFRADGSRYRVDLLEPYVDPHGTSDDTCGDSEVPF